MPDLKPTKLRDVFLITPKRHGDARGYFCETWNQADMAALGLDYAFVQDNQSLSQHRGTIRGLHCQSPPHAQAKLVRCGKGSILDVAVDIRRGSPTYGQWVAEELSAENGRQLLVPEGFLHGFMTLEADCEVLYKCSDIYAPDCDGAVRFDDADLAIAWGIEASDAVLSDKDRAAQSFADFVSPFEWMESA